MEVVWNRTAVFRNCHYCLRRMACDIWLVGFEPI
nr:MAG TPA: hypothetical protein [Caudoviricetes sp.]